jgi:outer membrane protein assembly factor BamA
MAKRGIIFILILFILPLKIYSQKDSFSVSESKNLKILPLPLFWYTPETKFGFGVAAMFNFRFNKKDTAYRVSTVQVGEAFTQEKQWINFSSFQLFPAKEKFYIYGEAGFYKYRYYFYGIGNDNSEGKKENYDIDFTRIRTNFLYRVIPKFYAGFRYWLEKHEARSTDTSGFLLNQFHQGYPSAFTSSPGLVFLYDSRDHLFFPTNGWFAEFSLQKDSEFTGSDFDFSRVSLDVSKYFSLLKKNVIALNVYSSFVKGDVPFTQLPMLGGNHKMRGYYEGRFRDNSMLLLQTEFRLQIFPRWFLNVFSSVGWVADSFDHLQMKHSRISGGLGIRFRIDKKQKINLRLDAATGKDGMKYYFTFNEAY